jgi:hypothetical protein
MSRTIKGAKGPNCDYWSRRPKGFWYYGAFAKKQTHKAERRIGKNDIKKMVE